MLTSHMPEGSALLDPSENTSEDLAAPLGIYIHVPYCLQRCSYCDFFTMPLTGDRDATFRGYLDAVKRELAHQAPTFATQSVASIFFGGGTPSLLHPAELAQILDELGRYFSWDPTIEITLEVNPETVDQSKASDFRGAGINRISMGVQSLSPEALVMLGRHHDPATARRCYDAVRAAGFHNVSLDMIYGRPGLTTSTWADELQALLAWEPSHLSMYELILEPGTPLTRAIHNGEQTLPSEDERLEMYQLCRDMTADAGMHWYEISNYARPDCEAQHNLDNWRGASYLGIGPGAHSFRASPGLGARRANPRNMPKYLTTPEAAPWNSRDLAEVRQDILLNGLRLREGLALSSLVCYGHNFLDALAARLPPLCEAGYLEVNPERWLVTPRGAELLDSIVAHLDMAPL